MGGIGPAHQERFASLTQKIGTDWDLSQKRIKYALGSIVFILISAIMLGIAPAKYPELDTTSIIMLLAVIILPLLPAALFFWRFCETGKLINASNALAESLTTEILFRREKIGQDKMELKARLRIQNEQVKLKQESALQLYEVLFKQWEQRHRAEINTSFQTMLTGRNFAMAIQNEVEIKMKQYPPAVRIDWKALGDAPLEEAITGISARIISQAIQGSNQDNQFIASTDAQSGKLVAHLYHAKRALDVTSNF